MSMYDDRVKYSASNIKCDVCGDEDSHCCAQMYGKTICIFCLASTLQSQVEELKSLRLEKARLDWLQEYNSYIMISTPRHTMKQLLPADLRAAIDNAKGGG